MRTAALCMAGLVAAPALAQTQAQMNATAATAYARADAEMSRQYAEAATEMRRRDLARPRGVAFGHATALLSSQRAWLRFRDAQCVLEGGEFAGGTLQAMTITACRTRLSDERRAQLRGLTRQ